MNFSMDTTPLQSVGKHAALAKRLEADRKAREKVLREFYFPDGLPPPRKIPVGYNAEPFRNIVRRHREIDDNAVDKSKRRVGKRNRPIGRKKSL